MLLLPLLISYRAGLSAFSKFINEDIIDDSYRIISGWKPSNKCSRPAIYQAPAVRMYAPRTPAAPAPFTMI